MIKKHPDRIDFTVTSEGQVIVQKFERRRLRNGRKRDFPIATEIKPDGFNLRGALTWCESNGYTVRRWHRGARAWKGEPWVIRTRAQIYHKRRQVEQEVAEFIRRNPNRPTPGLTFLDFAYDG